MSRNTIKYFVSFWQLNAMEDVRRYYVKQEEYSDLLEAENRAEFLNKNDCQHMAYVISEGDVA